MPDNIPPRPWSTNGVVFFDRNRSVIGEFYLTPNRSLGSATAMSRRAILCEHIVNAVNRLEPAAGEMCVVCHVVPVDSASGYDTCKGCAETIEGLSM